MEMAQRPSILPAGDRWFDSSRVAHRSRWSLDLPATAVIKHYAHDVLNLILARLAKLPNDAQALYPYRLALAHEDMHGEAFAYTLQTLGLASSPQFATRTPALPPAHDLSFTGGTFISGSPDNAEFVFDNEKWAHPVILPAFSIASTLVTNAQYKDFMRAGGYQNLQLWDEAGRAWLASTQRTAPRYWQQADGQWQCARFGRVIEPAADEAVRHISLHEAQAYCRWAERRLPTEAEWEYAAKGGKLSKGTKYSGSDNANQIAWHKANSNKTPHTIGTKSPNELGIYDMSGNVWEWCWDWYNEDYYKTAVKNNPTGPEMGDKRTVKGGSWDSKTDYLRTANRVSTFPDKTHPFYGFRIAKSIAQ
jgi:ergothioneine biosynthesis protein EgtB